MAASCHTHVILLPHPVSIHLPVCGLHPQSSFRSPPLLTPPGLPCRSQPSHRSLLDERGASSLVSPLPPVSLFSLFSTRQLEGAFDSPPLLQTLQEEAGSSQRLVRLAPPGPFASPPSTSSSAPRTAPHTCPGLCTGGVSCSERPRPRHCTVSLTSSSFQGGLTARLTAALLATLVSPYPALLGTHTTYHLQYSALPSPPELKCRLIRFVDGCIPSL